MIIKRDQRREPFSRDKMVEGIRIACRKRPVSEDQIEDIATQIEMKINSRLDKEIESGMLGDLVMEQLRKLDQVAYVRFASVYRQFKDVNQFIDELKGLLDMEAHDLNELRKLNRPPGKS